MLLNLLGKGWEAERVVRTNQPRINADRLPSHFKLDLALPTERLAVEIDGRSHCSLQAQERDQKKDKWLRSCGWTVFRFSNQTILSALESVLIQIQGALTSSTSP
jgi:very-short-patch-repair endonuclease